MAFFGGDFRDPKSYHFEGEQPGSFLRIQGMAMGPTHSIDINPWGTGAGTTIL